MQPERRRQPVRRRAADVDARTLVFDAVYNPSETKLLQQAEAAGAKTIGGVEMFVRQAAAQFEAWTEAPAPTDVMRRVVEERLARRS